MGTQSGIAEVLRRTIVAVCEVNVSFGANLEILGSVHIRSDDAKFASFMLEEQVFKDQSSRQPARTGPANLNTPSTVNRQTKGSSNPQVAPAKGSTNSTSTQENNTIVIEPTGTSFMDIDPLPENEDVQMAGTSKSKPDIYVDMISRAESNKDLGTTGKVGYTSNIPDLQDIPLPLVETPRTKTGTNTSESAKGNTQTSNDQTNLAIDCEKQMTVPGHSNKMPASKRTRTTTTKAAGSSADLPLIIKDEDLEEGEVDVEVVNIKKDPKQRLMEKMMARTRAAVTSGNKRSFVFHHFKMPASKQQKRAKKEDESTSKVEDKTDMDLGDDQLTIDEKDGDGQCARSQPVKCPKCGVILYNKYNLRRHMNSAHTKEKEFACEVCGKTFYSDNTLCKHRIRTHNIMGKRRRFREAFMMHHLAAMHQSPSWEDPDHMAIMEEHMKRFAARGGFRGCGRGGFGRGGRGGGFGRGGRAGFSWHGGFFGRGGFSGFGNTHTSQDQDPGDQKNDYGPSEEHQWEHRDSHHGGISDSDPWSHDPKDRPHGRVRPSRPHTQTQTSEQSQQSPVSEKAQNKPDSNVGGREVPQSPQTCTQTNDDTNRAADTIDLATLQQAAEHLVSLQGTPADLLQQSDSQPDQTS